MGTAVLELSRTYNSAATLADSDPVNLVNGGNLTISVNGNAQTMQQTHSGFAHLRIKHVTQARNKQSHA